MGINLCEISISWKLKALLFRESAQLCHKLHVASKYKCSLKEKTIFLAISNDVNIVIVFSFKEHLYLLATCNLWHNCPIIFSIVNYNAQPLVWKIFSISQFMSILCLRARVNMGNIDEFHAVLWTLKVFYHKVVS